MDLDRLAAAKLWLVSASTGNGNGNVSSLEAPRDLPYLAHALYALVPVASTEVPRATVDERWRLYVNPGWLAAASIRDIGRELVHLVWHLLADHADRARDVGVRRDTARHWRNAADVTVYSTLLPDLLVPEGLPSARALRLPTDRSAEEYYALLSRLPAIAAPDEGAPRPSAEPLAATEGCGSGADGVPRAHELPADVDVFGGVPTPDARHIRRLVAIAYTEHARKRGSRPGDAWRWAHAILEPRTAWEPLLARAVRRAIGFAAGRGEYTYSRPSRHRSPGIVLPGQRRPVPRVALVVDTSASVDDGLLARALGEIDGVLRALGGTAVTVYAVDAGVHAVSTVRRAVDTRLAGGGGTDMRAGLTVAGAARPRPEVIVVLTDGDTPWPGTAPPGAAVIIALLGRAAGALPPTPTWAERVECRLD